MSEIFHELAKEYSCQFVYKNLPNAIEKYGFGCILKGVRQVGDSIMNKKALIIGCSGKGVDYLPGVSKDVENFDYFLRSNVGGNWYSSEIVTVLDKSRSEILKQVEDLKRQNLDFLFVVYSGHGDYSEHKNCRRLWIDDSNFIYDKDLRHICNKELLIVDSCAGKVNDIPEVSRKTILDSIGNLSETYTKHRAKYEDAIRNCPAQEIRLYSCDIDESSSDTSKGGLYSKNMLKAAYSNNISIVLSGLQAHELASTKVMRESEKEQNPQYFCSVKTGNKLPFSIME